MAERKRNWMWRRLEEGEARERRPRPTSYRRPDYMINAKGQTVRYHAPHPMTPGLIRFLKKTERVFVTDDACIVWTGGDTFRVDGGKVTTPARYYWEAFTGEKLTARDALYQTCKTPRCVKHRVKK